MSQQSQQGTVALRPRAHLLAIIGRELIKDESVAISELVKNSYDADATFVNVLLVGVSSPDSGRIDIRDDGHGMTTETVLTAWAEPATSFKRGQREGRSPRGRILLGEKGVGRFAVDKLGKKVELITRREKEDHETVLHIDSGVYDKDVYLDEVKNEWETRPPKEIVDPPQGTILRITQLRGAYSQELVENIHKALAKLISPVIKSELKFQIKFQCSDYPKLTGEIEIPLPLSRAPWSIRGSVNENGNFTYVIKEGPLQETDL